MSERSWDFYFTHDGQAPLIVAVDLAFGPRAPVKELPERAILSVQMRTPMPTGLRASAEAPALFALEERLSEVMAAAGWAQVGRVVTRGRSDFLYYGPAGVDLPALPEEDYPLRRVTHTDEAWDLYRNFLWPGPRDWQQIVNRRTVRSLQEHGDDSQASRPVDHVVVAKDEEGATAAVASLREAGFTVEGAAPGEEEEWRIPFETVDAPARIDEVTLAILDAIEGIEGVDYDGWGCPVVPKEARP